MTEKVQVRRRSLQRTSTYREDVPIGCAQGLSNRPNHTPNRTPLTSQTQAAELVRQSMVGAWQPLAVELPVYSLPGPIHDGKPV